MFTIDKEGEKKSKIITFKVDESNFGGDMSLIVNNFKIFLRHKKKQKEEQEKDEEKSQLIPTCFLCGKKGHIRPNYPLAKKESHKKSKKPHIKGNRSYISCEDNDMES